MISSSAAAHFSTVVLNFFEFREFRHDHNARIVAENGAVGHSVERRKVDGGGTGKTENDVENTQTWRGNSRSTTNRLPEQDLVGIEVSELFVFL